MKARAILAALVACGLMGSSAFAQRGNQPDKPAGKPPAQPASPGKPGDKPGDKSAPGQDEKQKKMMEAMEAAGKPGAAQEKMAQFAGQWDATVKWRMDPDAPWTESPGSSSNQMWYDGRYLHQNFSSDMQGMPFKGMSVMGYNNLTKEYEATWIDNMSTGIMFMTGKADAAGKVFTFTGEGADPMQPGKKKRMREVTTINSAEKHTSEFFESGPNGKEFNSMTIVYTKKAGGSDSPAPIKPAPAKPGNDDKTKSKDGN
jgi:hypothetical protein